ncbi:hypothetical protein V6N11_082238 [Hibiscus sabdariffa]|uniref:Uncharacterized protein n=1 Tax=Hibiscus sabdariffa TaxID=183260 RepID=A0ABR2QHE9_9ROSI
MSTPTSPYDQLGRYHSDEHDVSSLLRDEKSDLIYRLCFRGIQSERFSNEKFIFLSNLGLLDFALIFILILVKHEKRGSGRQRRKSVSVDSAFGCRICNSRGF